MGGKPKAPPPPDYSGIANASAEASKYQYELGKEQLAWAKEQYGLDKAVTDKVVNFALKTQEDNAASARADRDRYEKTYQPIEDQLVSSINENAPRYNQLEKDMITDAESYNSPERQAQEAGKAQANVAQQFEGQRTAALQNLESFGVDPSSTRYAALDANVRAQQGASAAAAGNQAIQNTENTGRALRSEALGRGQALRSEAINIGRGMPGQVAQSYGTALQAGNQAVNSTLAQTASGANTMGTGLQWQQGSNQSLGTWSNALTSGYNAQMANFNANQNSSSGWGSALGMVGGIAGSLMMSDERMKENIRPVGKTFDGQKIYSYNFKGDDTPQIGLIAQEVEKRHPDAVREIDGIKGVDYKEATDDAAEQAHFKEGGAVRFEDSVPHMRTSENFEDRRQAWLEDRRGTQPSKKPWLYDKSAEGGGFRVPEEDRKDPDGTERRIREHPEEYRPEWGYPDGNFDINDPYGNVRHKRYAQGGAVEDDMGDTMTANPGYGVPPEASPSGGGAIDDVTAKVNVGEFIMPEDAVSWYGEKYFQGLIDKARKEREGASAKPEMKSSKPQQPTFSSSAGALPVG